MGTAAAATRGALDAATLAGTLAEPWAGLSVLPLAGLVDGTPDPAPELWVVEHVLEVARTAYRVVVVDLPATDGPAVATALSGPTSWSPSAAARLPASAGFRRPSKRGPRPATTSTPRAPS